MRITTLFGIVEKHFLDGRTLTTEEKSLIALVVGVKADHKGNEFGALSGDDLEAMVEAQKKSMKAFYLKKAAECE